MKNWFGSIPSKLDMETQLTPAHPSLFLRVPLHWLNAHFHRRYRRNEKFTWHLDALGPGELTSSPGGQRTATLLVYHTDLEEGDGGATVFRDLRDKNGSRLKL